MVSGYDKYRDIHKHGATLSQNGMQGRVLYVLSYAEAKQVLGDHKRFVKELRNTIPADQRPSRENSNDMFSLLYDNMLGTDAPDHTRLRSLVSKAFTHRRVQALAPRIQEIADHLIDQFEQDGTADLIEKFAFPLPIVVICELLGIPTEDRERFRAWSHAFLGIADSEYAYVESLTGFVGYIGQLIAARRAEPRDDLISALVHAKEDGQSLTEQELYSMIALLIVAGHETTVNLIGNGMAALLQDRDQLVQMQNVPEKIDGAIDEFLRYEGPVEMATTRYAAEDVQLGDRLVARGTAVVVLLAAVNRDPAVFESPNKLDINRDAHQHLGFSYGVHYCVGAPLARLEAKIAFNTLLRRLPNIRLDQPASQIIYNESSIVHGVKRLSISW